MRRGNRAGLRLAPLLGAVALALVAHAAGSGAAEPSAGDWTPAGSMLTYRELHASTRLADGDVLVTGGTRTDPTSSAELLYGGKSRPTGCMGDQRGGHTATRLASGKILIAGGSCGVNVATAEIYDPATGQLTPTGSMRTPRSEAVAVALPDGRVLVVGGAGAGAGAPYAADAPSAEVYDPAATDPKTGLNGAWSPTGSLHEPRAAFTATTLNDGRVLVVGGIYSGNATASAELWNPATGQWTRTDPVGRPRAYHTATKLPDGRVMVAGGYFQTYVPYFLRGFLSDVQIYDPAAGRWTTAGYLTAPRFANTATVLAGGKVLLAAGRSTNFATTSTAELFDPATGESVETAMPLNEGRYNHTATRLTDGRVLVAGGDGVTSAELYDPTADTWTTTDSLDRPRDFHSASLLPDGKVLLRGGGNAPVSVGLIYDPGAGTWASFGSVARGRSLHATTLLQNGEVLATGGLGYGPNDPDGNPTRIATASSERYDPAVGRWRPSAAMITARLGHTATLLPSGKVLVAGGATPGGNDPDGNPLPPIPLGSAEVYDPATNGWSPAGTLATARVGHTATLLPDGRVLVVGGRGTDGAALDSAERYDPQTNSWSAAGALGGARAEHAATLLPGGKVLVAGGRNGTGAALAAARLYDPAANSWSPAASLADARSGHTATLLPGARVLVTGGSDGDGDGGQLRSTELYDAAADAWTRARPLTTARTSHRAELLADGSVLVAGGIDRTSTEIYDPAEIRSGSWATAPSLKTPREGSSATLLRSGKVLVAGGRGKTGLDPDGNPILEALAATEIYDPATDAWSDGAPMKHARIAHAATLLKDGRVLVTGGRAPNPWDDEMASAEVYDPGSNTWQDVDPMPAPRANHTATLLADGRVLVVAARQDGTPSSWTAVYDPVADRWTLAESLSFPRGDHTATLLTSACGTNCGKVLIAGGGYRTNTAELFDPATLGARPTLSMSLGRSLHAATVLHDGRVIVTGGDYPYDSAEIYAPATETWSATAAMHLRRYSHSATTLPSGKVLVAGGNGNDDAQRATAELYDPATQAWRYTGSLATGRSDHAALLLPGGPLSVCGQRCGNVLVVGGNGSNGEPTGSAELYAPPPEITSVSPAAGPVSGDTVVTLTGSGLASVERVRFGDTEAASFTVDAAEPDGRLRVVAPSHSAGTVDIRVTSRGGRSAVTAADRFTYAADTATTVPRPSARSENAGSRTGAKLEVVRLRVLRSARMLDLLAPISKRASGTVRVQFVAAGRRVRFNARIDSARGRIALRRRLPRALVAPGVGMLTIAYPGDADTRPQTVRLRAASRQARLKAGQPRIVGSDLRAAGTISTRAHGDVLLRLEYVEAGETRAVRFRARIRNGRWRLGARLSAVTRASIERREGPLQAEFLFMGSYAARISGALRSTGLEP
jgi:N-acetylneuraminic acid mutarotase